VSVRNSSTSGKGIRSPKLLIGTSSKTSRDKISVSAAPYVLAVYSLAYFLTPGTLLTLGIIPHNRVRSPDDPCVAIEGEHSKRLPETELSSPVPTTLTEAPDQY
jgi:hypothetical protein